jgi:hypothetical protein
VRIGAFITETSRVRRVRTHMGEPPEPPRISPARGPPEWGDPPVDAAPDWDALPNDNPSRPSTNRSSGSRLPSPGRAGDAPLPVPLVIVPPASRTKPRGKPARHPPKSGLLPPRRTPSARTRRRALCPCRAPSLDARFPGPSRRAVGFPRSGRQGRESWRVKVPLPSIARVGRLAYPPLGEVTNRDWRGRRRHGCPGFGRQTRSGGGNDLGGEQTRGPEQE